MSPGGAPKWDLRTALDFARALDGLDIYWLEEPLDRHDYAGHAELRRHSKVRLAGGELSWRFAEYREMAVRGCLDVLQTDAIFALGIGGSRKVAGARRSAQPRLRAALLVERLQPDREPPRDGRVE